jgi:hypothetical protein
MADAAFSSEKGPELLYHLAQNPAEADRIARLPPTQASMEMGRLEAKLAAVPPRKTTQAPDPIAPVSGVGGAQTDADPDKMTVEQWRAWREKQLSR